MARIVRLFSAAIVAGVVAGATGFALYRYVGPSSGSSSSAPAASATTVALADITFTGLDGQTHRLADWHGKLLLVNFWATWCAPCRVEIPALVAAQKKYGARGFQVIGPAVDDPAAVRAQLGELGIDYPVMTGTPEEMIRTMGALGNDPGALPFSVLIGADGHIITNHLGAFSAAQLDTLIREHLPPQSA
ncbi:MAG TPA: TlpA disulfide reductase family protein [Nevskiaceae bacterium]